MLKLNKKLLAITILVVLLMFGCEKKQDNYIVDVAGQKLTSEVFTKRFKSSRDFKKSKEITFEQLKTFIDKNFLENLLFQAEGYNTGIDKEAKVADFIEKKKVSLLTDSKSKLIKKLQDVNVNITEQDVKDFYNSLTHEVKVAHIMVRSKSLADSLNEVLQKDVTKYHEFARKHSLDMRSGAGGGVLGKFFIKGTFPPTFEEAAFSLEKLEISQPVKTRYGFHLIKLMDKRPFENQPFEKVEKGLRKKLESIERNKSFDKFYNNLHEEYSLSINEDLLKFVVKNMETKTRMLMINKTNITESQLKETILEYKGGKWTLETMIDNYNSSQSRGKMPLESKDIAIDYIYKTITPDLIYKKAVAEGYDKDEEYLEKIKSLEEQQVKRVCQQKLLNEKVNVTEEEIENYYNENKEKYKDKTLDKVRTRIKNELSSKKRKELKANVIKELKEKFTIAYNDIEIDRITVEMNEQKKKDEEAKAAKAKLKEKETEKTKPSDIDKKEEKTKKKK